MRRKRRAARTMAIISEGMRAQGAARDGEPRGRRRGGAAGSSQGDGPPGGAEAAPRASPSRERRVREGRRGEGPAPARPSMLGRSAGKLCARGGARAAGGRPAGGRMDGADDSFSLSKVLLGPAGQWSLPKM